jgi:hypothetical protein
MKRQKGKVAALESRKDGTLTILNISQWFGFALMRGINQTKRAEASRSSIERPQVEPIAAKRREADGFLRGGFTDQGLM